MTVFWFCAVAMIIVALILITPALLGRRRIPVESDTRQNIAIARERLLELESLAGSGRIDEQELARERHDLESALLDDLEVDDTPPIASRQPGPYWAVVVLLGVPLLAGGIYLTVGNPAAISNSSQQVAANPHAGADGGQMPEVGQLMAQLETKLEQNPDDPRGWALAGRTYMSLGQFDKAVSAYERLRTLVGDDPNVLTGYADALIMANQGQFTAQSVELLQKALSLSPNQPEALWLSGMEAETRGEFAQALEHWNRLMPLLSEDPASQQEVQTLIDRVQAQVGDTPETAAASPAAASPATTVGVEVEAILDPQLLDKVSGDDTVFIFARAPSGPPMPLAASRHQVSDLPVTVTLDDSMAMSQQMKLSNFDQVLVSARVAKSGNPIGQSGDLESAAVETATPGTQKIQLLIDRIRP